MKVSYFLLFFWFAGLSLMTEIAQADDTEVYLAQIQPVSEQTMRLGRSAHWTLPLVATEYQPLQPTLAMQAAMRAQHEGRFLDALILLNEEVKRGQSGDEAKNELKLLHASFLLQGYQSQQTLDNLKPLLAKRQHAAYVADVADVYALTAMAYLQQGKMQEALDAAQHACNSKSKDGILPHLALSYALQGMGRLAEARKEMHDFNAQNSHSAIALAREAELALTLDQIQAARTLAVQAREADAAHPYVIAVSGLVYLIDGHAGEARQAFETALQRDPKDAKALFGLGLAEIKLGNFQAGQEKLQAANDADPSNALILTYLGRSQQNLGQTEAARASWRSAQQADLKDPIPWLYQAQMELQANQPQDARESLRQSQARLAYRSVYRGELLLKEDEQLLLANLAEVQRQLGMEKLAFYTLSSSVDANSSANLRNQADVLQGQRFGESARRSLLLQSQFNARPGNLPAPLDIYGDGAGLTGAANPQHGFISELAAHQTSYNNYDELFSQRTMLEGDATTGSKNSSGGQIRASAGSDTLGVGIAKLQFKTDGFAPYESLDNRVSQGIVQWQPDRSTQAFLSRQTFNSEWGATFYPAAPWAFSAMIGDNSQVTRLGLRHDLTDDGRNQLWGLLSHQLTDQAVKYLPSPTFASSGAHSEELQYRRTGAAYATQWGMQQIRGDTIYWDSSGNVFINNAKNAQQVYAAWQQALDPNWQLDAILGWGKIDSSDKVGWGTTGTYLKRWLPHLGVVYTPDSATHLRLAAWRGMGIPGLGDATLAPVSLAGFLLTRPGDIRQNGLLVNAFALGADRQLSPAWLLTAETQQRRTVEPAVIGPPPQIYLHYQVDESKLALHWQPEANPWIMSLVYDYEQLQNDSTSSIAPDSVNAQTLRSQQVNLRWFASAQLTANCALSHNQVVGTQQSNDPVSYSLIFPAYRNHFNQVDASLSWKFSPSHGALTAGVRNAADTHFQYTEIDKLNPRFSAGRLLYAKLNLVW